MGARDVVAAAVLVAAVPEGLLLSDRAGDRAGVPAAVVGALALAVAVSWPTARDQVAWPGGMAAAVSLTATASVVAQGDRLDERSFGLAALAEMGGLLLLLALVARWSPLRVAVPVGLALAAAGSLFITRFMPSADALEYVGGLALWSIGPAMAVVVGGYPRLAAARLDHGVRSARQGQALVLAHDLHDFVAHDVSGIVAQAQAARFAAGDDPARLRAALERIEDVGLHALSAMDEMVDMLGDPEADPSLLPGARLTSLPALVDRFGAERLPHCRVHLDVDPRVVDGLAVPAPVEMVAFRVVVESLTNVRRHAPDATLVQVRTLVEDGDVLRVEVTNDAGPGAPLRLRRRSPGGTGLPNLRQRVEGLGGELAAGPYGGGWTVTTRLPLREPRSSDA
jgi:signal transduction histidine kinase